jgi:hypothetical protein
MQKLNYRIAVLWFIMANFILIVHAQDIPEFDGGYIQTIERKYMEMKVKPTETIEGVYAVKDKDGIIKIASDQFKGILIRGQRKYKFEAFSLHPLLQKVSQNKVTYFTYGNAIEMQSKAMGDDAYYFQARTTLSRGEYIARIERTFWLFSITSEGEGTTDKKKWTVEPEKTTALGDFKPSDRVEICTDKQSQRVVVSYGSEKPVRIMPDTCHRFTGSNTYKIKHEEWQPPSSGELDDPKFAWETHKTAWGTWAIIP